MGIDLLLLSALVFIASAVGTVTGFGTSTIMVPILLLFFPPPVTLLFVGIIHLFGDIWKMLLFKKGVRWKLILLFGIPGVALSYLGASIGIGLPETSLSRILGVFLISYVLFLFTRSRFKIPKTTTSAIAGGALSGLFAGIFGIGGAVRGAFLSAFNLPKAVYLFTNGAIAFVIDVTRTTTYFFGGTKLEAFLLWGMVVFIPVSFLGAKLAQRVVHRIPEAHFRWVIGFFLSLVGLKLIVFP